MVGRRRRWFRDTPLLRYGVLVVLVFVVGVVGYRVLGGPEHGWVDALYLTVITLTTVGYTEVIDSTGRPEVKLFTTVLLLLGVGGALGFLTQLTAEVVEGTAQRLFWRRGMLRRIARMSDHTIVCGAGHTGEVVLRELIETERPFVLVEHRDERVRELQDLLGTEFPVIEGDAMDDDVLLAAGVERACELIACVSEDRDNLMVTVSARILGPKLRIVCRCDDDRVRKKMLAAGADAVVSQAHMGGMRLVSEAVRPVSVEFLDRMLQDRDERLRVESTPVEWRSPLEGTTVGELRARRIEGLLLLAVVDVGGEWIYDPPDACPLPPGCSLVYMGGPTVRHVVEGLCRAR